MMWLDYFIKLNAVFTALFLLYYFFLRKEKFLVGNRVVLWSVVIASICLPLSPAIYTQKNSESKIAVEDPPAGTSSGSLNNLRGTPAKRTMGITAESVKAVITRLIPGMMKIYLLVVLFLSARFFLRLLRVCFIIRASKRTKREGIVYCEPAGDIPPFSFFHFIVASPHLEEDKYNQIITHERAHCLQRHTVDLLLSDVTAILLWVNPVARLYRREVSLNLEYLADKAAIARGIDATSYQLNLLSFSLKTPFDYPATPFASRLRERIKMMNASTASRRNRYKYLILLPALVLLSMLTGFEDAETDPGRKVMPAPLARLTGNAVISDNRQERANAIAQPIQRKQVSMQGDGMAEIVKKVYIDAKTDTVVFRLLNEPIATPTPFDGVYVVGDKIIPAADMRKALQPTGELRFILPARPKLAYYRKGDAGAIEKWGEQAGRGVVLLEPIAQGRSAD